MKCFNHQDMEATATCQGCGKGLCNKCATRFDIIYCESCLLSHNKSVASQMYYGLILTLAIFIGVTWFCANLKMGYGKAFVAGLLFSFTYWGWKFLSERFPKLTMGSVIVWGFYFFSKFAVAYFIGIIVGPYQIFKMATEIQKVNRTKIQIMRGEI